MTSVAGRARCQLNCIICLCLDETEKCTPGKFSSSLVHSEYITGFSVQKWSASISVSPRSAAWRN